MLTNQLTVLLLFVVISAESSREFLSIAHAGHSPWLSNLTRRELINVKRICGRESRKHEPIFKISGGDKAAKGQFPWAVGLAYRKGEAFCGATIISQKHIISAAHCFFSYVKGSLPCMGIATQDPFSIEVHYGGTCTRRGTHCSKANTKIARIRKVRYARAFHEFNCKGGSDIAIAEIEGSFQFDDLVKPICLPPIAEAKEFNSTAYSTFTDYGFGLLDEKDSHTVAHLRYIDFPPSAIDVTDDRGYIVVVPGKRSGRLMNKGICKGDSGSGFQARRISDQRVYLQGMHSFGPPCGSGLSYWNTHVVHFLKEICEMTGIC
ncbi:hypothetical protein QR680_010541 [Steinernema hermaphroditum]|uniref:Peptidase S1 domain-containing protein n=1 Tax=Steinernema hermaphroditum TaxID=289476 RepID=A0AA39IS19_9BILA|nr:hypothetical protein QR680_010541 [Steinernema hermaphroditum]